jgi:gentisate 1,2-dioxygenase
MAIEGDQPVIWLDGLDIAVVRMLETNFREFYPEPQYPLGKPDDLSLRLHGCGSLKPTWVSNGPQHSPLLNYKYAQTYAALKGIAAHTDGTPCDGVCLEYVNPLTGGPAMATIACFATLLKAGFPDAGAPAFGRHDLSRDRGPRTVGDRRPRFRVGR